MQFMLLLENAAALVNLHKLYNSLSLFIKSLSNILAPRSKRGKTDPRFQLSVISFPARPQTPSIHSQKEGLLGGSCMGQTVGSGYMGHAVWLLFIES